MKKYILTPIFAALVSTLFVGCKDKAESEQLVSTKNMIKNIAFKDLAGKNINMVYYLFHISITFNSKTALFYLKDKNIAYIKFQIFPIY